MKEKLTSLDRQETLAVARVDDFCPSLTSEEMNTGAKDDLWKDLFPAPFNVAQSHIQTQNKISIQWEPSEAAKQKMVGNGQYAIQLKIDSCK